MAQGQRSSGRQAEQGNGHKPMTENQSITANDKLQGVLKALDERGEELAGVLPKDLPLVAFLANVNSALRLNPKLLRCTFESIVSACVKAAYDGLRIDGREAAIVDSKESYKDGNGWKEREVARYMPMVLGLIKQILQSGAALAVKAVIVYRNEAKTGRFTLLEGTTPGIHHQPFVEGEDRGEMIGAYAIATLPSGIYKHEWMDKAAILDVQNEAKTDKVWTRWPTEMWKKTVIRRLRKSLSGVSSIRDMEAAEMFPQFDRSTPHPQLADRTAPPRPTRALEHQQTVPFDLRGGRGLADDDGVIEQSREREKPREQPRAASQAAQQSDPKRDEPQIPLNPEEWGVWRTEVVDLIGKARDMEGLVDVQHQVDAVYRHAPKPVADEIAKRFTDRAADLAAGPDDGAAAGGPGDDDTADGDR